MGEMSRRLQVESTIMYILCIQGHSLAKTETLTFKNRVYH